MPRPTITTIAAAVVLLATSASLAQVAPLSTARGFVPFEATSLGRPGDQTAYGTWVAPGALAINNSGDWAMVAAVDSPSLGFAASAVFSSIGRDLPPRYQREVDGVDVTFLTYPDLDLNNHGDMAYSVIHVDPEVPRFTNQLFFNDRPLIRSEDDSPWDFVPEFGPVAYGRLDRVQLNDNGQALVGSSSPGLPAAGNAPNLISRLDVNTKPFSGVVAGAAGRVVENFRQIRPFDTQSREYGFNNSGQVGHGGLYEDISDPANLATLLTIDSDIVVRGGDPTPKPGTIYTSLSNAAISLNNSGDWAMTVPVGDLQADRPHIIRNGNEVIIDPFEPQDSIGGLNIVPTLTGLSLTDAGDVFYFGLIADLQPDNTIEILGSGLFLNDQPLVVLGVTQIDGMTIESMSMPGSGALFDISDNGQWLIAEVEFENGSSGAYRFAIPAPSTVAILMLGGTAALRRRR